MSEKPMSTEEIAERMLKRKNMVKDLAVMVGMTIGSKILTARRPARNCSG